MEVFSLS